MAYTLRASNEDVMIAEGAVVAGDVTLGRDCSIWYNAVLRGDVGPIVIGDRTNIQECVVIHERTTVGSDCTIGHSAIVHGCTVGDNTLIGMGAVVLDDAVIGKNCIIGANALVTARTVVPDGSLVLGSPAKVIRPLTEAEIQDNRLSAEEYLENMKNYRRG